MGASYRSPLLQSMQADRPAASAESATSESMLDQNSFFDGLYRTSQDLRIAGEFKGTIECEGTVIVVENARVNATVRARNLVLAGSATGEIVCSEQFTLQPTGQMRGKVQAGSLVVEEGAFFEGEFQMATAATPAPAATARASSEEEGAATASRTLDRLKRQAGKGQPTDAAKDKSEAETPAGGDGAGSEGRTTP